MRDEACSLHVVVASGEGPNPILSNTLLLSQPSTGISTSNVGFSSPILISLPPVARKAPSNPTFQWGSCMMTIPMSTISPDFPNHSQSNMQLMKLNMRWLAMAERFMEYHEEWTEVS
ncbi:unnamed protein product [Prunus brigantina]